MRRSRRGRRARAAEVLAIPQLVAQGTVEARELLPSFLYLAARERRPAGAALGREAHATSSASTRARAASTRRRASSRARRAGSATRPSIAAAPSSRPARPRTSSGSAPSRPRGATSSTSARRGITWSRRAIPSSRSRSRASCSPCPRRSTRRRASSPSRPRTPRASRSSRSSRSRRPRSTRGSRRAGDAWRKDVKVGDVVLVVDVGGGTTDFSVIAAIEKDGELALERVAVGDHILLGGDNMDLALAHIVEQKMLAEPRRTASLELDRWQRVALQHAARGAKEKLLGDSKAEGARRSRSPARARSSSAATLRAELTRDEVDARDRRRLLPRRRRRRRARRSRARAALTQLGLPYAQDAGGHEAPRGVPRAAGGRARRGRGAPPAARRAPRRRCCIRRASSSTAA